MKKLIYILLGLCLLASTQSCTEVSASPLSTEYTNVKNITDYKLTMYGRVNVSVVEYNGKTFLITTAYSGSADGGISVNTIELK